MKLEIGYNSSFEVRKEVYYYPVSKAFSILYLSDFHFNKFSGEIASKITDAVDELNPTILLLGGDYVDSNKGFKYLKELAVAISGRSNVFAIAGNHDYFFGIDRIKNVFTTNNLDWIEKSSTTINLNDLTIQIHGNQTASLNNSIFNILCSHQPIDLEAEINQCNLSFSGHLHGGQIVLWQKEQRLFPGKLFYKRNVLKQEFKTCLNLISKGLGDTLPIRYNCKKDMIFVEIK